MRTTGAHRLRRRRPAPRLTPSAGAGLALLVALGAAATAAATCVLPLALLGGVPANVTLSGGGAGGADELGNYLVVLRRDAPADALDELLADVAARQGSVVTAPPVATPTGAGGNATDGVDVSGVFTAVVYRALRGPAVQGLAACLSPAAAAYLAGHPRVQGASDGGGKGTMRGRPNPSPSIAVCHAPPPYSAPRPPPDCAGVVEDPFISLQQQHPRRHRHHHQQQCVELRGWRYGYDGGGGGGPTMREARGDDVDVRLHPPTGAWRVLPPVAGAPLSLPTRGGGRHRRPPHAPPPPRPPRDNAVEAGASDGVDLVGRYAFHAPSLAGGGWHAPRRQLQQPASGGAATRTQKDAPWHLGRINNRKDRKGEYEYVQTGAGVDVYVLDSGINAGHQEFTGRVQVSARVG
jgi:hypothetical protein